ncbi:hypothetical protein Y1Q_0003964 [Alligator mississippiensis]|uniref:Uncharacterized protein n=1 Tax=Alligator mississippiensis TaxID=8496 RepID=A0A151PHF8_ALLMI|nr:hypothetical protein Y1Q_0003964 [Alligator mississippiensis]
MSLSFSSKQSRFLLVLSPTVSLVVSKTTDLMHSQRPSVVAGCIFKLLSIMRPANQNPQELINLGVCDLPVSCSFPSCPQRER